MKKTFLVLTTLFILLGSNLALAVSELPDTNISGDVSGEISGEISGEVSGGISGEIGGDVSGELVPNESGDLSSGEDLNVLNSTANNSSFKVFKNKTLTGAMEASTSGDETFIFVIVTEPTHGSVSHSNSGDPTFTYVPTEDYVGEDSFTFRLESGDLYSNVATVSITVENDETEIVIPFNYIDMKEHWANYSASHLAARGFIIGEEIGDDFYYFPDRNMTRGEFLLFLLSIVDPAGTAAEATVTFADEKNVPDWMLSKAKKAYELEIISGVGSSNNSLYLYADKAITREEAFVMINNALLAMTNIVNATDALEYNDASKISSWATGAIKNLTAYKIIQGDNMKNINASSIVNRGQAAELCFKLLKQLENSEMTTPSGDVK